MTRTICLGGQITLHRADAFDILADEDLAAFRLVVVTDPPFELYTPEFITGYEAALPKHAHNIVFSKFPHTRVVQNNFRKPMAAEYIWHFTDMTSFRSFRMPLLHHETVTVFSDEPYECDLSRIRRPANDQETRGRHYKTNKTRGKHGAALFYEPHPDGRWPSSVIHNQRSLDSGLQLAKPPVGVKPVDMLMQILPAYITPECTVLDPFMGTGSVGLVAIALGARYVGVETNDRHFNVALERLRGAWKAKHDDLFAAS